MLEMRYFVLELESTIDSNILLAELGGMGGERISGRELAEAIAKAQVRCKHCEQTFHPDYFCKECGLCLPSCCVCD